MRRIHIATAIAVAAFAFTGAAANAEAMKFKAALDGASETPPNDSKGTGMMTATFDPATGMLTWSIDYSGLTGPAVAAHFHGPAPAGKAAGVEVPLAAPLDSPIKGSAKLTPEQAKDLTSGQMYVNIHTAEHKPGEIRGQVEPAM